MCLGIPGEIITVVNEEPVTRAGEVSFGGVVRKINLACVPEAVPGDYVIVHAGIAISKVNEKEAAKVFEFLGEAEGK